jgi:hypothetical protein
MILPIVLVISPRAIMEMAYSIHILHLPYPTKFGHSANVHSRGLIWGYE